MKRFIFIFLVLCLARAVSAESELKIITELEMQKMTDELLTTEGHYVDDKGYAYQVYTTPTNTAWVTKPTYVLHPAIYIRDITVSEKKLEVKGIGYATKDSDTFRKWLKGFDAQNRALEALASE